MYRINDTVSAVKEVQRLLGLNQTGYYNETTRNAVLHIQELYGLRQSGFTDYSTFRAIVREYNDRESMSWNNAFIYDASFPYLQGDKGDSAGRINEALTEVLKSYSYEYALPRGKYISADTLRGVNFLQKVFDMPVSQAIDQKFMNRIMNELESIEIKKAHS